jgi:hypothetical protein
VDSPERPNIIALANNSDVNRTVGNSAGERLATLGGIVDIHTASWASYVGMYSMTNHSEISVLNDPIYTRYMYDVYSVCPQFRDPWNDVYASINKAMVYAGAVAAKQYPSGLPKKLMDPGYEEFTAGISGSVVGDQLVFHTYYSFFVAAALVELVCIAVILPTYREWWTLGRPVSFSPLEFAKAFNAPMLAAANSNSSGRDLANELGDLRTKYGVAMREADPEESKPMLTFADPDTTLLPASGTRFAI